MPRVTTKSFIENSKKIHGCKYEYTKVDYIGTKIKVTITCKIHGDFDQTPRDHIRGSGCKICGRLAVVNKIKNPLGSFVVKSSKLYDSKYDYSKSVYVDCTSPLIIICPSHGEFEQTPIVHLQGSGCVKCEHKHTINSRSKTIDLFIEEATAIHGNKYDYSKTVYVNNHTLLTIVCPEHGDFLKTPITHLKGKGCPKCNSKNCGHRSNTKEFIEKSIAINGDRYTYDKVNYIDFSTKIIITCKTHGDFEQTPSFHLSGQNCKKCAHDNMADSGAEFIKKSQNIHGEKYGYELVDYIKRDVDVTITCPVHGNFQQKPSNHLKGNGCVKCGHLNRRIQALDKFAQKAVIIHGDKYDYSKVDYINSKIKVIITCQYHGDFLQTPSGHLKGRGCAKCANMAKKTTDDFISESKIIHGDLYDYSKVNYVNYDTKVIIICANHGEFLQTPDSHLHGKRCAKCAKNAEITTDDFITRSKLIHKDKYNYSKVNYTTARKKVLIECGEHGDFYQEPRSHLNGSGCSLCAGNNIRKTTDEFIADAEKIHEDLYDYSLTNYVNNETGVMILCGIHGEFTQTPTNHLRGTRCPKCVGGVKKTREEFITNAISKHGITYDYSKVDYVTAMTKVIIICKKHGEFTQTPNGHLAGHECPHCSTSKGYSKAQIDWLDYIGMNEDINIQHALSPGGEYRIPSIGKIDGWCEETNTVFEYNGDFFHGNPLIYDANDYNKKLKKTYGELYQKTLKREEAIRNLGYNLVVKWESDEMEWI